MEAAEIWQLLPHRYPFILVDRVLELVESKKIVAIKNITLNEPQFTGHFPGTPIFPGVMIVEAMAQAACILAFKSRNRVVDDGYLYYLAGTDKTKFKRSVVPGDQLRLEIDILNFRRHWLKVSGNAFVGEHVVCTSHITCAERKVV